MKNKKLLLLIPVALFLMAMQVTNPVPSESLQILVGLILGVIGLPLTDFLKNALKIEDRAALSLTLLIALALTIVDMFIFGLLTWPPLWDEIVMNLSLIFGTASFIYAWLNTGQRPTKLTQ